MSECECVCVCVCVCEYAVHVQSRRQPRMLVPLVRRSDLRGACLRVSDVVSGRRTSEWLAAVTPRVVRVCSVVVVPAINVTGKCEPTSR